MYALVQLHNEFVCMYVWACVYVVSIRSSASPFQAMCAIAEQDDSSLVDRGGRARMLCSRRMHVVDHTLLSEVGKSDVRKNNE